MKKKTLQKWKNKNISFYLSLTGTFLMGTVHLIATQIHFSWLTLNYCLFSYLLFLMKLVLFFLGKTEDKNRLYAEGAVSLAFLVIPMAVSMVKTIMEKEAPSYPFFWFIYLYALYGTVKMISSIHSLHTARFGKNIGKEVLSWISFISSLYTIQMLEFAMIAEFDQDKSGFMTKWQYFTQGAILLFTVFLILYLIWKYISYSPKNQL